MQRAKGYGPYIATKKDKKGREWAYFPHGYRQFRTLVGLGTIPDLQVSGKMMEDLVVRVTVEDLVRPRSRSQSVPVTEIGSNVGAWVQSRENSSTLMRGTAGIGKKFHNIVREFKRAITKYRGTERRLFGQIIIEVGFSTQASYKVAEHHHIGPHPRRFAHFRPVEQRQIIEEAERIVLGAQTSGAFSGLGAGEQPRDARGRFIKVRF